MKPDYQKLFGDTYTVMGKYIQPLDEIMELGCRDDRAVISSRLLAFSKMVVVDRQPKRIQMARSRISNPNVEYLCGDFFSMELPVVDVVLTTALIHHHSLDQLRTILSKMAASAKRYVMISGPNAAIQTKLYGDHQYHIAAEDVEEACKDCGLKLTEVATHPDHAPPVTFFREAINWVHDGVITIIMEKPDAA